MSGVCFERGVDSQGFARMRSKGDQALFGGNTTHQTKLQHLTQCVTIFMVNN